MLIFLAAKTELILAITPGMSLFLKITIFPFGLKSVLKPFNPTMRCSFSLNTVPETLIFEFFGDNFNAKFIIITTIWKSFAR